MVFLLHVGGAPAHLILYFAESAGGGFNPISASGLEAKE